MKHLINRNIFQKIVVFSVIIFSSSAYAGNCTAKDYKIYKAYDAYLDANPQIDDDTARKIFSAKVKMKPSELKSLYFNCLIKQIK